MWRPQESVPVLRVAGGGVTGSSPWVWAGTAAMLEGGELRA